MEQWVSQHIDQRNPVNLAVGFTDLAWRDSGLTPNLLELCQAPPNTTFRSHWYSSGFVDTCCSF